MQSLNYLQQSFTRIADISANAAIGAISTSAIASGHLISLTPRFAAKMGAECYILYRIIHVSKETFQQAFFVASGGYTFPPMVQLIGDKVITAGELAFAGILTSILNQQKLSLPLVVSLSLITGGVVAFRQFVVWSIKKSLNILNLERLPKEIRELEEQKSIVDIEIQNFQSEFGKFDQELGELKKKSEELSRERQSYLLELGLEFSKDRKENDDLLKVEEEDLREQMQRNIDPSQSGALSSINHRKEILNQLQSVTKDYRITWEKFQSVQNRENAMIGLKLPIVEKMSSSTERATNLFIE